MPEPVSSATADEQTIREWREHFEWATTLPQDSMDGISAVNLAHTGLAVCEVAERLAAALTAAQQERARYFKEVVAAENLTEGLAAEVMALRAELAELRKGAA